MKAFMIATLLLFASTAYAQVRIVDIEENVYTAKAPPVIEQKDGKLFLKFEDQTGKPHAMECQDIAEVGFASLDIPTLFDLEDVLVTLTNGDVIFAKIAKDSAEKITLKSDNLGDVVLGFERIKRIEFLANSEYFPKPSDVPAEVKEDTFLTKTGDRPRGTLQQIGPKEAVYIDKNPFTLKIANLAAIYLCEISTERPKPTPLNQLYAIVTLRDGKSTLQGHIVGLASGILTLESFSYKGVQFKIATDSIANLYFKNGRVIYLSDIPLTEKYDFNYIKGLQPSKSDFTDDFAYRRDKSCKDTKLSIRGTEFKKGLGVHARSKITCPLNGAYKKFVATVGIDDIADSRGKVVFEVWVDGQKKFSRTLTRKDDPVPLAIDVDKATNLELVVEFTEVGTTGACGDWGMARLIR